MKKQIAAIVLTSLFFGFQTWAAASNTSDQNLEASDILTFPFYDIKYNTINVTVDLHQKDRSSGKSYCELRDAAFERNMPWLISVQVQRDPKTDSYSATLTDICKSLGKKKQTGPFSQSSKIMKTVRIKNKTKKNCSDEVPLVVYPGSSVALDLFQYAAPRAPGEIEMVDELLSMVNLNFSRNNKNMFLLATAMCGRMNQGYCDKEEINGLRFWAQQLANCDENYKEWGKKILNQMATLEE